MEKHSGTLFSGGTVEITIPSDYIGEDVTQDELDAAVERTDGFKSATLNADGSVTYVLRVSPLENSSQARIATNSTNRVADGPKRY